MIDKHNPFFTISLDFELFWGMRDVTTLKDYGSNILGGREAIPKILSLFRHFNINATWAVVGLATFKEKSEMEEYFPSELPKYFDMNLSPYEHFKSIGENEDEDPYHFGYSLFKLINETPGTEIASHSFSHFYCLEKRRNYKAFKEDLMASKKALNRLDVDPKTYIFCRNQYSLEDLKDLKDLGFEVFRGNENTPFSHPKAGNYKRALRLSDSYIDLSGNNSFYPGKEKSLINIPASRFLRPASRSPLENFRLSRIKKSMTEASLEGKGYHLWWHPHNFGNNIDVNILFLTQILEHFSILKKKYNMQSLNMMQSAQFTPF